MKTSITPKKKYLQIINSINKFHEKILDFFTTKLLKLLKKFIIF